MKNTKMSAKVRKKVKERDSFDGAPCCIYCGNPYALQVAHVVNASQGGLGIEENGVTLCAKCHIEMDNGKDGYVIRSYAENYLKGIYEGWDRAKVVDDIDPEWRYG